VKTEQQPLDPRLDIPYQVLGCRVVVSTDVAEIAARVRDVAVAPQEDLEPAGEIAVEILRGDDGCFEIHAGGGVRDRSCEVDAVIAQLEAVITRAAVERMGEWTRLHAGCVVVGGARILVSGDKGAGKTTTLLKLLLRGQEVLCDENVLLRGGDVLPVPRKFHLRDGTIALMKEFAPVAATLRKYHVQQLAPFHFFDPTDLGHGWRLSRGPVDAVLIIEPNRGGRSTIAPLAKTDLVLRLLLQAPDLDDRASRQIREISSFVAGARPLLLRLGDLDEAVDALERLVAG